MKLYLPTIKLLLISQCLKKCYHHYICQSRRLLSRIRFQKIYSLKDRVYMRFNQSTLLKDFLTFFEDNKQLSSLLKRKERQQLELIAYISLFGIHM